MTYEFSQKSFSDKQQGKRPMAFSFTLVPKRVRTKVKVRQATPNARVVKKKSSKNQIAEALCHKVKHLLPEDSLQVYQKKFLNNPVASEYYVGSSSKVELKAKFLKPFSFHHMLKFIGLNKKYNPDYVKVFYCNMVKTLVGL